MNGKCPSSRLDRLEKGWLPAPHPFAGLRCLGPGWNVPRSRETPEVIQSNHVYVTQQSANPIDAPPVTRGTKRIPVVDRIAP